MTEITDHEIVRTYEWVAGALARCKVARNATEAKVEKAMLGGKCKAYVEVLSLLEGRYGKIVQFPERISITGEE